MQPREVKTTTNSLVEVRQVEIEDNRIITLLETAAEIEF